MRFLFVATVLCFFTSVTALYTQCKGANVENLEDVVSINSCRKTYCRLKKKTKVDVVLKFTADKDIPKLTNTVSALIAGIPFPFIGVDGESACGNIFEADGETKANCPLKAGTSYVYKNNINVLEIYPRVKVIVHWALTTPDKKDVICFEVPARIVN